jgi:hypothetical protein
LVCYAFFHKPETFRDKIRAKTFLGENIGPDMKVLVPDVKVLLPDVKVLVPDVEVLIPRCEISGPWMCQIVSGNSAGEVLRKMKAYG